MSRAGAVGCAPRARQKRQEQKEHEGQGRGVGRSCTSLAKNGRCWNMWRGGTARAAHRHLLEVLATEADEDLGAIAVDQKKTGGG
jgi:hypothetical protein